MLPDEATIITCSYSGTVANFCTAAVGNGKNLRVLALESRAENHARTRFRTVNAWQRR
jgi:translation initiation factor 2B subunit (eIF-2B alpha/beta/delta family)